MFSLVFFLSIFVNPFYKWRIWLRLFSVYFTHLPRFRFTESVLDLLRRSNQSILKEISPGCSLEGMRLTLKLQYFGHLTGKDWCWEGLGAGGEGDDRGWNGWMALLTQWTWVWTSSGSWWWTRKPGVLQSMGFQRIGHDRGTELNWTKA